ncbi:MAG: hypothetical protein R3251_04405 [Candidatus Spechtbacterales bacterium]|nr:hypothetical protein [Candidatus Spechtbacterales bacterium]
MEEMKKILKHWWVYTPSALFIFFNIFLLLKEVMGCSLCAVRAGFPKIYYIKDLGGSGLDPIVEGGGVRIDTLGLFIDFIAIPVGVFLFLLWIYKLKNNK